MATVGHLAVGVAAARLHLPGDASPRQLAIGMALLSLLSFAPDADTIAFSLGVPYAAPWGHRGAAHSPLFAAAAGCVFGLLLPLYASRRRTILTASLVLISHGLLDTMTSGGLGIALLWPLSRERFFAPWRPLDAAPIGLAVLSPRGLHLLAVETLCFLPLLAYGLWPRQRRHPQIRQATPARGGGPGTDPRTLGTMGR